MSNKNTYARPTPLNCPASDIEELAKIVVRGVKYSPGDDMVEVVKVLGGNIEYADLRNRPEDGSICVDGPRDFKIVLSRYSSERRNRFTICHELGHYFLHAEIGEKRIEALRYGSGQEEWEANCFAAEFLMPRATFKAAIRNGADTVSLAAQFNVSRDAARIRMNRLANG